MGAICLGPTGNAQGGHWFFSLTSGSRINHHCWTALPMPQEVILRVSQIGRTQGMPFRITYVNRRVNEISDRLEDFADDEDDGDSSSESDDETYAESGSDQDSEDDGTIASNGETASSEDDDDDDDDDSQIGDDDDLQGNPDAAISSDVDDDENPEDDSDPPGHETDDPVVPDAGISWDPAVPDDDGDEEHSDVSGGVNPDAQGIDVIGGSTSEDEEWEGECGNDSSSTYGCEDEDECESDASSSAACSEIPPTESEQFKAAEAAGRAASRSQIPSTESELFEAAEAAGRAAASSHDDTQRRSTHIERRLSTRKRIPTGDSALQYLVREVLRDSTHRLVREVPRDSTHRHDLEDNIWGSSDYNFLTAQMSAKRGLRQFGQRGADTLMKELQ